MIIILISEDIAVGLLVGLRSLSGALVSPEYSDILNEECAGYL